MLQNEIKLMLKSLINNKKDFKKFYKTGHFSYSQNDSFKGEVAIINNSRSVISYLQDANDEFKVVATADFKDGGTLILKLFDKNHSHYESGKNSYPSHIDGFHRLKMRKLSRDDLIRDISSIQRHCAEAKENVTSVKHHSIINRITSTLEASDEKLSKQEVLLLLENSLNHLDKARHIDELDEVCPKVNVSPISPDNSDISIGGISSVKDNIR